MHRIVQLSIFHMYESCDRHSYYVRATTDEGMTKEVDGYRTGSTYNDYDGLTRDEARDRALTDAETWGDFLGITPDPYIEDGVLCEPLMMFDTYTTQRELAARKAT